METKAFHYCSEQRRETIFFAGIGTWQRHEKGKGGNTEETKVNIAIL